MKKRLRLLRWATVPLYVGPLLAGLGGADGTSVAWFSLIFVLWLFVLRPHEWPRVWAEWSKPDLLIRALTQAVVQVLLVTVLFGIGRGIGGVFDIAPIWPWYLPLSISFLSIPLSRLIWDPWAAVQMDMFLDEVIAEVKNAARPVEPDLVDRMLAPLLALPDDTNEQTLVSHLDQITRHVPIRDIADALIALARQEMTPKICHRALVIVATTPRMVAFDGRDLPAKAFAVLPRHPDLLSMFSQRAAIALKKAPELWDLFPSSEVVEDWASRFGTHPAAIDARRFVQLNNEIGEKA